MYAHHAESLQNMIDYFSGREEIIALVFGGSVAKGCERPDSDLDAMVVVTDEYYAQREKENRVTETISGYCTYEGGYFDVKYMTKAFIAAAADHASEPTRNSFIGARVLFSRDPEIPGIVARIPVFQKQERADKELSFFANLMLNYHYFWKACEPDGYMRLHVAGQIVYSIYRMILQENEILFPCNRRLEEFVENAPKKAGKHRLPVPGVLPRAVRRAVRRRLSGVHRLDELRHENGLQRPALPLFARLRAVVERPAPARGRILMDAGRTNANPSPWSSRLC